MIMQRDYYCTEEETESRTVIYFCLLKHNPTKGQKSNINLSNIQRSSNTINDYDDDIMKITGPSKSVFHCLRKGYQVWGFHLPTEKSD